MKYIEEDRQDDERSSFERIKPGQFLTYARNASALALRHLHDRTTMAMLAMYLTVRTSWSCPINHVARVIDQDQHLTIWETGVDKLLDETLVKDMIRHHQQERLTLLGDRTHVDERIRAIWMT